MAGNDLFGWLGGRLRAIFGSAEPPGAVAQPRSAPVEVAPVAPQPAPDDPDEPVEEAGPPPALDPGLLAEHLAAVVAEPASREARQVFGDWLEGLGHPWGRLVALHHAAATARPETRALLAREADRWARANRAAILGDLPAAVLPHAAWDHGFLDAVVLASPGDGPLLVTRLRALLALPAARVLRDLTLHCAPTVMHTPGRRDASVADVIAPFEGIAAELAAAPPTLRALAFGVQPPTAASAYVSVPDLAAVADALPGLASLAVRCRGGDGLLAPVRHAALRTLEVRLGAADARDLRAIGASELPALERLVVSLGADGDVLLDEAYPAWGDDYNPPDEHGDTGIYPETYPSADLDRLTVYESAPRYTAADLAAFLGASWPPGLVHLGLQGLTFTPDTLGTVLEAPVVARLRSLDLSGGTLADGDVDALVRSAERLAHLSSLDLDGNRLTSAGIARLRAALPNATTGAQRPSTQAGPAFLFRYVVTVE